jgi:hypothetical protein
MVRQPDVNVRPRLMPDGRPQLKGPSFAAGVERERAAEAPRTRRAAMPMSTAEKSACSIHLDANWAGRCVIRTRRERPGLFRRDHQIRRDPDSVFSDKLVLVGPMS